MKKLLVGSLAALAIAAVPFAATHALDPVSFVPACTVGADPTLQYSTLSFNCEAFTDPDTGVHYNAIDISTPAPNQLP